DLPLARGGVDDLPRVVAGVDGEGARLTRLGVHLHLHDVGRERIAHVGLALAGLEVEGGGGRHRPAVGGQAHLLLRAEGHRLAPAQTAVGDDRLHGRTDLRRRIADRVSAHHRGAAGPRGAAVGYAGGVRLYDVDQLDRAAQRLGRDL